MILLYPQKDIPPLPQTRRMLKQMLNNSEACTRLLAGLNYNTLQALNQLGINILNDRIQETDGYDPAFIDKLKLGKLILKEKEKLDELEKISTLSASVSSLIRLQAKLIHALEMLYLLLGTPNASIDDIYHLIVVIAAIHRAIDIREREVKQEAEFAHVREIEHIKEEEKAFIEMIENPSHFEETVEEVFTDLEEKVEVADPDPENDELDKPHLQPISAQAKPDKRVPPPLATHFVPSAVTFKTELEIVLKKHNTLTNQIYDNTNVPLQFEAKAFALSQDLHCNEEKSKDGHTFLFTQSKLPHEKVSVTFRHDGVHFSAEKASMESLAVLQRLINAYEKSVDSLPLKTDWKIHAHDATIGFKAMSVANACGANMNSISGIKVDEAAAVKPSEIAKVQRELKEAFKDISPHLRRDPLKRG